MSKQLPILPDEMRKPGTLTFQEIPVNTYQKSVKDELNNFTTEEFMNIYRDMLYIREFETMLNLIKTTSEYEGITYNHPGPAHLGIGQEAAYVGEAFHLPLMTISSAHTEVMAKFWQRD